MTLPPQFTETRESLHALAEHVLCAARYRAMGRIGLQVVEGGFATPPFGDDRRTIAVEGTELVLRLVRIFPRRNAELGRETTWETG